MDAARSSINSKGIDNLARRTIAPKPINGCNQEGTEARSIGVGAGATPTIKLMFVSL